MTFLYALAALIVLFATQRLMARELSRLVHRFGGGHNAVIWFWSVIFLPGTLLHEVSHFLVAALTGARTGDIEIFPEFIEEEIEENETRRVRLGSVQVQKMNPVQGFLVGLAPFITGSALLVFIASILMPDWEMKVYWKLAFEVYIFFTVANSFFPSWEDLRHTLPLVVIFVLIGLASWFLGFRLMIDSSSPVWATLKVLGNTLFLSAFLNVIIFLPLLIVNRIKR